jgi:hypothetical protein
MREETNRSASFVTLGMSGIAMWCWYRVTVHHQAACKVARRFAETT